MNHIDYLLQVAADLGLIVDNYAKYGRVGLCASHRITGKELSIIPFCPAGGTPHETLLETLAGSSRHPQTAYRAECVVMLARLARGR